MFKAARLNSDGGLFAAAIPTVIREPELAFAFLVRILHSLLHTGLSRRTKIAITLIDAEKREAKAQTCAPSQLLKAVEYFLLTEVPTEN